jgi:hypothetical protein
MIGAILVIVLGVASIHPGRDIDTYLLKNEVDRHNLDLKATGGCALSLPGPGRST